MNRGKIGKIICVIGVICLFISVGSLLFNLARYREIANAYYAGRIETEAQAEVAINAMLNCWVMLPWLGMLGVVSAGIFAVGYIFSIG